MGASWSGSDVRLAGRGVEQQQLAEGLEAAASGRPCAVVVHGEAGIGKTRLVRDACARLSPETQVLWGTCVHFGAASVPFAPVTAALRSWLARADDATEAAVMSEAGELRNLLAAHGVERTAEPGRLLPLIDLVLNRLAARAPTVVVIDDLHWADRTSLDVLAYLIAGFRGQSLALLATCRDEQRADGLPVHSWLADMRRMPGFLEIGLDRLDREATDAQIEGILGHVVEVGFTAYVHERSAGNPYLTELLVQGLSGSETELPGMAPAELKDALLASWHGVSEPTRQVTRLLAVGGRPLEFATLAKVASEHGVERSLLSDCLGEARDHGLVGPDGDGRLWFRHPLLADVLYDGLPPGGAERVHATYVQALDSQITETREHHAADLALHNHRAGRTDDAYRWSLVAANHAADLHAAAEEALHLERACSLWPRLPPELQGSTAEYIELLHRASQVCRRTGRHGSAVALVEQALDLVDRTSAPLLASTLLLAWWKATYRRSGPGETVVSELVDAVRLTDAHPDSLERALALAELAAAEHWEDSHEDAGSHANEAARVALRSRSGLALAAALSTRALVRLGSGGGWNPLTDPELGLADAQEAARLARSCGSTDWLEQAAYCQVLLLMNLGRTEEATVTALELFDEVLAAGSVWAYALAELAASLLLRTGHWNECRDLLRTALAARCEGILGASVRLTAARLAARCGRLPEARLHLDRARELVSDDFAWLRARLLGARGEVFMASGQPQEALRVLYSRSVVPAGVGPNYSEDHLVELAHAAAETARAARDAGDAQGVKRAVATLDDLIGRWPQEPFATPRPDVVDQAMAKALFDAEVARLKNAPGQAALWRDAISKCHAAGVRWQAAMSQLRCAEAMLAAGSPRSEVSDLLRHAHRTAVELGAQPLRNEVEALARMVRVSLRPRVPTAEAPRTPGLLAGLTARELEILSYLVAGQSNGAIAKELVISEKTVSVHVSNILRKTGTSTRLEAATLAGRLSGRPDV